MGNGDNQVLIDYLQDLESQPSSRGQRVAPATIRAIRSDLRAFITWWERSRERTFAPALVLDTELDDYVRQRQDECAPATINRSNASLRAFFAWAVPQNHLSHNPAARLRDLPIEETAPRGLNLDGVEWLMRAAMLARNPLERTRDLALLTLLSDCGLRSQEAADLELRDVAMDEGVVTVQMGKGRKPRRVVLNLGGSTIGRLQDYISMVYPTSGSITGAPTEEIAQGTVKFLVAQRLTKPGQPWEPGMRTVTMRKRLIVLRGIAIELIREQIAHEQPLDRIKGLVDTIQDLETCSPHALRHGLAYRLYAAGMTTKTIARQFGHSRETTAMKYGK